MSLTNDEETYVKELFAVKQKQDQIKALSDTMWSEIQTLKDSNDKDKWTKIVERKQIFYIAKDNVLTG